MKREVRARTAARRAEKVLENNDLASLPVDPFALAEKHAIEVEAKPDSVEGVSGMLLRHGNKFGILYATHIPSEGFQRFSVSHELGHYFLDGHLDHVLPEDGVHESRAGFFSADSYEQEADYFAAGLLMPSRLFRREMNTVQTGLAAVEHLCRRCGTSLTSTAIRYADLADHAAAIVISTGAVVDFCFMSDLMKSVLGRFTWPARGSALPSDSASASLSANRERVRATDRVDDETSSRAWFDSTRSVVLSEEAIGLGRYGRTLTVLSAEIYEEPDEDDEEEDELAESWTPRFRR